MSFKITQLTLVALLLSSITVNSQHKSKILSGQPHQEVLSFKSETSTEQAITSFIKPYGLEESTTTLKPLAKTKDRFGVTHERYSQYYKGLRVQFGMIISHSNNGVVSQVNGELYNPDVLSTTPRLSAKQGFQKAVNYTSATTYLWEDVNQSQQLNYKKPDGELLIYPDVNTGEVHLAYKYDIYATKPLSRNEVFVDANSGDVLYVNPIIKHADRFSSKVFIPSEKKQLSKPMPSTMATGTAATRYDGEREIQTKKLIQNFVLEDETRGDGIVTYNCEGVNAYQNVHFRDEDNIWSSEEYDNAEKDNGALNAHWGAETTYDFWKILFNRNSFDDKGAQIISYVHYDNEDEADDDVGYDNAFWNGSVMTYGDGNRFDILTSLDVCAHEIGHAICTFTADLAYQNQSGGMNEGYSDIWGACVEQYGRTGSLEGPYEDSIWQIAEDIANPFLRSMSNPNVAGDPDTYLGDFWIETADEGSCEPTRDNDRCGVHTNSGVLNHWFYLLTVGGEGTNNAPKPDAYSVEGIGMAKAAEIAYLVERDYLTPNATLADARNASIIVSSILFCGNSPETIAVTNAWHAVNVGEAYEAVANDVALVAVNEKRDVSCSSDIFNAEVTIENFGTETVDGYFVRFWKDGEEIAEFIDNGSLSVCESKTITIDIPNLSIGANIINVDTGTFQDGRPENNIETITVVLNNSASLNTVNTFEEESEKLVSLNQDGDEQLWEKGAADGSLLNGEVANQSTVYGTNLSSNYSNQTVAYLVSQCYDLSNVEDAVVKFDMAFSLETNWDIITFQYSIDGGDSWGILGSAQDDNWFNSARFPSNTNCFNCLGAQWTGVGSNIQNDGETNATLRKYEHSLDEFGIDGSKETNVIFRFLFQSDQSVTEEGAIIDNFVVTGTVKELGVESNEFTALNVFPNPTNGLTTITADNITNAKVSVIDLRGRLITTRVNNDVANRMTVDISELAAGSYFFIIETDSNRSVRQIIKR